MKLTTLLLAGLCIAGGQAHASLFADDEARTQAQQLDVRTSKLEEASKQQAEYNNRQAENNKQQAEINEQQAEINKQQAEINKQQTRSMLDLQTQIEAQNTELRRFRGQIEELVHNLQNAEKRQKDFYIDLDARVRHFETIEATAPPPVPPAPPVVLVPPVAPIPPAAPIPPVVPVQPVVQAEEAHDGIEAENPAMENRAYEAAHGLFKAGHHQEAIKAFQEFLKKYPESVHVPNVYYGAGSAYFALGKYKNALDNFQLLVNKYSFSHKVPDAMLSMADCQRELKAIITSKKTLMQIIDNYPGSEAAGKASKRLEAFR